MKKYLWLLAIASLCSAGFVLALGYSGGVKPTVVTETPAFASYFEPSSLDKLAKSKGVVVSQFNMNFAEEEYIDLRAGGVKRTMDDAMLNLQFKIVNYDKAVLQAAANEIHAYMIEKFTAEGFVVKDYDTTFKTNKKFGKLKLTESANGNAPDKDIAVGSRPGFNDIASAKFISFSANSMPSFDITGMKGASALMIGMDSKADVVNAGFSVHFIEWEGSTGGVAWSQKGAEPGGLVDKVEASFKPQIFFGTAGLMAFPHEKMGHVVMINHKPFGYTFGREFVTEIKEGANKSVIENATYKTYEITIDNEKFKAAVVELGKSYVDNMVLAMKNK